MITVPDLAVVRSPFSVGEVLLSNATTGGPVMCLAPVGVRAYEGEAAASLDCWRCTRWAEAEAMLAGADPDRLERLSVREVVLRVPESHRDWLRAQLRGQLQAIVAFGEQASHARGRRWSEQAAKRLRDELAAAFPDEPWHVTAAGADEHADGRVAALAGR